MTTQSNNSVLINNQADQAVQNSKNQQLLTAQHLNSYLNSQQRQNETTVPPGDNMMKLIKERKLRCEIIDQINFVRLSLIYSDEISQQIGQEYVKKCKQLQPQSSEIVETQSLLIPQQDANHLANIMQDSTETPQGFNNYALIKHQTAKSNFNIDQQKDKDSNSQILTSKAIQKELKKYCENHAIFFYQEDQKAKILIPRRKPSSRVELNGIIRRRGSILNLLYQSPNYDQIQEQVAADNNNDSSPIGDFAHLDSIEMQQQPVTAHNLSVEGSASINSGIDHQNVKQLADEIQKSGQLVKNNHQVNALLYQKTDELKLQKFETNSQSKHKHNHINRHKASQDAFTPTLFFKQNNRQMRNHQSNMVLTVSAGKARLGHGDLSAPHHLSIKQQRISSQERSDTIHEPMSGSSFMVKRSFPITRISRVGRHGSYSTFDLSSPMKKIITRKLSMQGFIPGINSVASNTVMTNTASRGGQDTHAQNDQKLLGSSLLDSEIYDFTLITPQRNKNSQGQQFNFNQSEIANGVQDNQYDSMSSEYDAESGAESDIRALQFFSKEKQTRIDVGQKKQLAWKLKQQSSVKSSKGGAFNTASRLKNSAQMQVAMSHQDDLSQIEERKHEINVSYFEETFVRSSTPTIQELQQMQNPSKASQFASKRGTLSYELSSESSLRVSPKPSLLVPTSKFMTTGMKQIDNRRGSVLSHSNRTANRSHQSRQSDVDSLRVPKSRSTANYAKKSQQSQNHKNSREDNCQSNRSQCFTKLNIQKLKESLMKSTKEKEEDKAAEIRYDRFLMLQSLSRRMKKFYKFEYGQYTLTQTNKDTANKTKNTNDGPQNADQSINEPRVCEDSMYMQADPVASKFRKASTLFKDDLAGDFTPSNQRSQSSMEEFIDSGSDSSSSSNNSDDDDEIKSSSIPAVHVTKNSVISKSSATSAYGKKQNKKKSFSSGDQDYQSDDESSLNSLKIEDVNGSSKISEVRIPIKEIKAQKKHKKSSRIKQHHSKNNKSSNTSSSRIQKRQRHERKKSRSHHSQKSRSASNSQAARKGIISLSSSIVQSSLRSSVSNSLDQSQDYSDENYKDYKDKEKQSPKQMPYTAAIKSQQKCQSGEGSLNNSQNYKQSQQQHRRTKSLEDDEVALERAKIIAKKEASSGLQQRQEQLKTHDEIFSKEQLNERKESLNTIGNHKSNITSQQVDQKQKNKSNQTNNAINAQALRQALQNLPQQHHYHQKQSNSQNTQNMTDSVAPGSKDQQLNMMMQQQRQYDKQSSQVNGNSNSNGQVQDRYSSSKYATAPIFQIHLKSISERDYGSEDGNDSPFQFGNTDTDRDSHTNLSSNQTSSWKNDQLINARSQEDKSRSDPITHDYQIAVDEVRQEYDENNHEQQNEEQITMQHKQIEQEIKAADMIQLEWHHPLIKLLDLNTVVEEQSREDICLTSKDSHHHMVMDSHSELSFKAAGLTGCNSSVSGNQSQTQQHQQISQINHHQAGLARKQVHKINSNSNQAYGGFSGVASSKSGQFAGSNDTSMRVDSPQNSFVVDCQASVNSSNQQQNRRHTMQMASLLLLQQDPINPPSDPQAPTRVVQSNNWVQQSKYEFVKPKRCSSPDEHNNLKSDTAVIGVANAMIGAPSSPVIDKKSASSSAANRSFKTQNKMSSLRRSRMSFTCSEEESVASNISPPTTYSQAQLQTLAKPNNTITKNNRNSAQNLGTKPSLDQKIRQHNSSEAVDSTQLNNSIQGLRSRYASNRSLIEQQNTNSQAQEQIQQSAQDQIQYTLNEAALAASSTALSSRPINDNSQQRNTQTSPSPLKLEANGTSQTSPILKQVQANAKRKGNATDSKKHNLELSLCLAHETDNNNISPLSIKHKRLDSAASMLFQRQLSPDAARLYQQRNFSEESDYSDGIESLDHLKKLFSESATKGDGLIQQLTEIQLERKKSAQIHHPNFLNMNSETSNFMTEPNTTINRNKNKNFFSTTSPGIMNKTASRLTQTIGIISPQSAQFNVNDALSAAIKSPQNQDNLIDSNLAKQTSIFGQSSTSAAYRKAQKFSVKRRTNSIERIRTISLPSMEAKSSYHSRNRGSNRHIESQVQRSRLQGGSYFTGPNQINIVRADSSPVRSQNQQNRTQQQQTSQQHYRHYELTQHLTSQLNQQRQQLHFTPQSPASGNLYFERSMSSNHPSAQHNNHPSILVPSHQPSLVYSAIDGQSYRPSSPGGSDLENIIVPNQYQQPPLAPPPNMLSLQQYSNSAASASRIQHQYQQSNTANHQRGNHQHQHHNHISS